MRDYWQELNFVSYKKQLENVETRLKNTKILKILQDFKDQEQKIMISKSKELEKIDEFTSKLDENTAWFNLIVADKEKSIKLLNQGEETKVRYRLDEAK